MENHCLKRDVESKLKHITTLHHFYGQGIKQSVLFKFMYMDRKLSDFGFHILYIMTIFLTIFSFVRF